MFYKLKIILYVGAVLIALFGVSLSLRQRKHGRNLGILFTCLIAGWLALNADDICFSLERNHYYDLIAADHVEVEFLPDNVQATFDLHPENHPETIHLFLSRERLPEQSIAVATLTFYQDNKEVGTVLLSKVEPRTYSQCTFGYDNQSYNFSGLSFFTKGHCYCFPSFFAEECLDIALSAESSGIKKTSISK